MRLMALAKAANRLETEKTKAEVLNRIVQGDRTAAALLTRPPIAASPYLAALFDRGSIRPSKPRRVTMETDPYDPPDAIPLASPDVIIHTRLHRATRGAARASLDDVPDSVGAAIVGAARVITVGHKLAAKAKLRTQTRTRVREHQARSEAGY